MNSRALRASGRSVAPVLPADEPTTGPEGLSPREAARRLREYGPNEPAPIAAPHWAAVLLRQFQSKLIIILVAATAVSLALGEWLNAGAIGVTVVVSAIFGFINEFRSERAIAALRQLTALRAEVIRGGLHEEVAARDIVPGDRAVLGEGRTVPADGRILEARGLLVNESILTGEPVAVAKDVANGAAPPPEALVSAGTTVVAGSGTMLVTATGRATALGAIFASVTEGGRRATPLERRLDELGNRLLIAFLALVLVVSAIGLGQGRNATSVLELAISLAIGAVPEGLPAVATTALAVAVQQLARRNVLIRRLDAVETLGSTTVIATDKTGTLTENRQVVRTLVLPGGEELAALTTESPGGRLETAITATGDGAAPPELLEAARGLLLAGALCNDAIAEYDAEDGWHTHGDPSEGALVLAATGLGLSPALLHAEYPRVATIPFTSASRSMTTTHRLQEGGETTVVKGAPEQVLAMTGGNAAGALHVRIAALSAAGFRLFGVARGPTAGELQFLGVVVLEDPIRPDAAAAVEACHEAGLRVILVTGDQRETAQNVARATGILEDSLQTIPGADVATAPLEDVAVIARASHHDKQVLVGRLQAAGAVVAMTGDGVNDAPALRAADVGVAVGPNATDVAKEAAQILLADGRLAALRDGIAEGRQVIANLRRAIVYLLTASFATILVIAAAMTFTDDLPLAPLQILWLNLVVHVFPALALSTGSEGAAGLDRPSGALMSQGTWREIGIRAVLSAATASAVAAIGALDSRGLEHDQALVFSALGLVLIGQSLLVGVESKTGQVARLRRRGLWLACAVSAALGLVALYVPGLNDALGLAGPDAAEWAIVLGAVLAGWVVTQAVAAALRRPAGHHGAPPAS